jgi:hypothetical protein
MTNQSQHTDFTLSQLQELLQNAELKAKLKAAQSEAEASKVIAAAAAAQGYTLSEERASRLLAELMPKNDELSEDDLLGVAGGMGLSAPTPFPTSVGPTCRNL